VTEPVGTVRPPAPRRTSIRYRTRAPRQPLWCASAILSWVASAVVLFASSLVLLGWTEPFTKVFAVYLACAAGSLPFARRVSTDRGFGAAFLYVACVPIAYIAVIGLLQSPGVPGFAPGSPPHPNEGRLVPAALASFVSWVLAIVVLIRGRG